ncbi:MAG: EamA family transporter [Deltaproteobacteria bacterium]|jgi:drug/metabolite transporter (DMT)-like permease|nr:EamA family transporter [Deltaproteobacteria bacterium]
MPSSESTRAGYMFVLLAAIIWSSIGILSRLPISHGITPLEIGFWRAAIGGTLFIIHALATAQHRIKPADALRMTLFGLACVGLFFPIYALSVQKGGAAQAAVLLYTAPFWVVVAARIFFKESLTIAKLAALVIAAAGVALLCLSGGGIPQDSDIEGVLYGLASGLLFSGHFLFSKVNLERFSAVTIYMYGLCTGALFMLPLVDFQPKGTDDWVCLFGIGAICTYLGYVIYCAGLRRLDAGKTAILCNLEPVLATIMAVLIWDEMFSLLGWLGASMVLVAVFLVILDKQKTQQKSQQ